MSNKKQLAMFYYNIRMVELVCLEQIKTVNHTSQKYQVTRTQIVVNLQKFETAAQLTMLRDKTGCAVKKVQAKYNVEIYIDCYAN